MGYAIVIMAVFLCFLSVLAGGERDRMNRWMADCRESKGIVQTVNKGFWSTRYECFIDGEEVTLPGWEAY